MSYLGSWKIDDLVTFTVNTHDPSTGAATDADAAPPYRVYEDETGTAILTGTMALLDDANTVGFYSEQITLSSANGFEKGKTYNVYVSAAVGGVTGTTHHILQVEAEVDSNVVSDKTGYSLASGTQTGVIIPTVVTAKNLTTNNDKTGYSLAAGQLFVKKNTALSNFMFMMIDSSDHVSPKTGLTVSGEFSVDGGAFASMANSVTEVGSGFYKINVDAGETNGTVVALKFTATGADATNITIITQA